ncbi:MAG: hypothetical protein AAFO70_04600 [Pseudomonadota bacterium]
MNALSLTLRDLTRTLSKLDLNDALAHRASKIASGIESDLGDRAQFAEASVQQTSDGVAVHIKGPRLWDREFGNSRSDAEGNLDAALRRFGGS